MEDKMSVELVMGLLYRTHYRELVKQMECYCGDDDNDSFAEVFEILETILGVEVDKNTDDE